MKETPRLSIIIPCHNSGDYIEAAIDSVISQSGNLPTLEIVVIDDHSSEVGLIDHLYEIESKYSGKTKIQILRNIGMRGAGAARNTGIAASKGEWIAFLDSDDLWTADSLEKRWQVIYENPDAKWICSDYTHIRNSSTVGEKPWGKDWLTEIEPIKNAFDTHNPYVKLERPVKLMHYGVVWLGTVMVHKDLLLQLDGFNESLRINQDFNLWVKLASISDLYYVTASCAYYRLHDQNTTIKRKQYPPRYWKLLSIDDLLEDSRLTGYRRYLSDLKLFYLEDQMYTYRKNGDYLRSISTASKLLGLHPFYWKSWKNLLAAIARR